MTLVLEGMPSAGGPRSRRSRGRGCDFAGFVLSLPVEASLVTSFRGSDWGWAAAFPAAAAPESSFLAGFYAISLASSPHIKERWGVYLHHPRHDRREHGRHGHGQGDRGRERSGADACCRQCPQHWHPRPSRSTRASGQAEQRPCGSGSPCPTAQRWHAQPRWESRGRRRRNRRGGRYEGS